MKVSNIKYEMCLSNGKDEWYEDIVYSDGEKEPPNQKDIALEQAKDMINLRKILHPQYNNIIIKGIRNTYTTIETHNLDDNGDLIVDVNYNTNDFSINEIISAVNYGFKYCTESQHKGFVPRGNILQWVMGMRKLIIVPKTWSKLKNNDSKNNSKN